MKSFIVAILIFVSLIAFGIFTYNFIEKTSADLVHETELLQKNVHEQDWNKAEKNFATLTASWNRVNEKWTILVDHQELDNINIRMSRIKEYIEVRHLQGLAPEVAELKLLLQHIPQKETINLDNML